MPLRMTADADFRYSLLTPGQREAARTLENAALGVHWVGPDGTILWANETELRMLGYAAPAYIGRCIEEFAADKERLAEASRRLARGERLRNFALSMRAGDGSIKDVLLDSTVVWDRRRFVHTVCFTREASDERALRRDLEQARAETVEFAGIASHDLHAPLRKILIFVDRLRRRSAAVLDGESRDYLERIQRSAERMEGLVDDLRALSKLTTEARPMCPLRLEEAARDAIADLGAEIARAGARVEAGSLPDVRADPGQVRLLLRHLIGNALKFRAPQRACVVRVDGKTDRDQVELRVSDNGIGFEPRYGELIFRPFQRLHGPQEYGGSGLGLTVCRRIVERHGGSIRAEGRPGEGASFIVRLPTGGIL